ncbi:RNA-directed DNA polymerase from mobile element jockey [Trichonephila clavipes]|nr:RNA-directed DNA polymerase from mobile element jockey [Trichonephila clavipes]
MKPSLNVIDTALPVAQDNQGRDQGLGRGPCSTNVLRSPTSKSVSINILQYNINRISSPATRTILVRLIELADECSAQIITLQETKLGEHTFIKLKTFSIYRVDRPHGVEKRRLINIFNSYHTPNQVHLPVNLFDFADKDAIFLGDLNAKHRFWGCTASNTRGYDLLNAAGDKAPISLNDDSPTHTSFSYGISEALDVSLVSLGLFPHCD